MSATNDVQQVKAGDLLDRMHADPRYIVAVALLAEVTREYRCKADTPTWQPIETAPKNETLLLHFVGGVICSGRQRYGFSNEPQQNVLAWRCDCCGRFATPAHWKRIEQP